MTLRKSELEEINDCLQTALRAMKAENARLKQERQRLVASLEAASAQYRRLSDYIRRLRTWAEKRTGNGSEQ